MHEIIQPSRSISRQTCHARVRRARPIMGNARRACMHDYYTISLHYLLTKQKFGQGSRCIHSNCHKTRTTLLTTFEGSSRASHDLHSSLSAASTTVSAHWKEKWLLKRAKRWRAQFSRFSWLPRLRKAVKLIAGAHRCYGQPRKVRKCAKHAKSIQIKTLDREIGRLGILPKWCTGKCRSNR